MDIKEFLSEGEIKTQKNNEVKEKVDINKLYEEIGLNPEKIDSAITARFKLLDERTKFLEDEKKALDGENLLEEYYRNIKPERVLSEEDKKIMAIGSLFSDIGKTGPKDATIEQQNLIITMFAVEDIKDPSITVEDFLNTYIEDGKIDEKIKLLKEMGLSSDMSMKDFYNKHAFWTYDIISGDGVPREDVVAAASHHILEMVNPGNIIGEDGTYRFNFGNNKKFDRPEVILVLEDKYYAFRRRLGMSHKQAITALKKFLDKRINYDPDTPLSNEKETEYRRVYEQSFSPEFRDFLKREFIMTLNEMDEVLKNSNLYSS
ncbi:MAG: hypothetical protein COV29_03515 [Candidatus Yanofskybacteria bacterium CG10_big_fil_rev_8_21_14_0_10_36_16]|uniref:Uncharacterized protein n=1 Tax=Candidatus Yanofskybacteria bacterium CG10_big_fil_rev_8_21_14_0_10_36_16 TaxID=1975096 RepID=A0A2J0Q790_9BACT|nr:MAG: hypothetical protein COV29_03515 [Candidatus Yanofskybacteria bacterium CG10_big_fil_rev_8_21_14_0_10_36_16]